jgi:uncharacterized protein (DUF342 family)
MSNNEGKIGIKSGKIIYVDGENPPKIIVGEGVEVYINEKKIDGECQVKKEDIVKVVPKIIEGKRNLNIYVTEDAMEVYIDISYEPYIEYEIEDMEPQHELFITGKIKHKSIKKFTREEIEKSLREKNIIYGIKKEEIERAIDGGRFLVAEGKKIKEPEDDRIVYYFGNKNEEDVENSIKVDYFNRITYEYVEKGDILAEKFDGRDGSIGFDVYGRPVKPRKRVVKRLLSGPGCVVNENKAYAEISGMPEVKSGKVCVFEVLRINGDVNIKTGNIKFDGNVEVVGTVKEGFKIRAGNNVIIHGDVLEAEIATNGNIVVKKNVISSNLIAGCNQINNEKALKLIKDVYDILKTSLIALTELIKLGKIKIDKNIGRVLMLIIESKFPNKMQEIIKNDEFISSGFHNDIYVNWKKLFNYILMIKNNELLDYDGLTNMLKEVGNFIETFQLLNTPADVYVSYCQNSKIFASNDVEITGQGCYNTNIVAKNHIRFISDKAIFRGGQMVAEKAIKASEVGSNAGVITILKTSKHGIIEARVAFQNTLIQFDDITYKIEYPVKNLKAYIEKGELIVEKLKL